jgi:putative MFS transporter
VVGVVLPVFGQGGVFTLGALSFAVAALAVWMLGIETRGVALEALASEDATGETMLYPAVADKSS